MILDLIKQSRNSSPLRTQLGVLLIASFILIILPVIAYTYISNSRTIIEQQVDVQTKLLRQEALNLDSYLAEIDRYSLLLRHDAGFMDIIKKKGPLDYRDQRSVQGMLRNTFYSRNDILSYRLYMINSGENYEIEARLNKVNSFDWDDPSSLPYYGVFTSGRYYRYFMPVAGEEGYIRYFRTIIRIENQEPLAIVELAFDTSHLDALTMDHRREGENLYIADDESRILYKTTDLPDSLLLNAAERLSNSSFRDSIRVGGYDYIAVSYRSPGYNYTLYNLIPRTNLDSTLTETRNLSLLIGFIAVILTLGLSSLYIRLLTTPLQQLSDQLAEVGTGNFSSLENIGGSREIVQLTDSFNAMTREIDDLIKKTYVSALNEKTAQLKALEAQLNPHMLYNTLQAISSEAIVNKQMKINFMITALANMLRYSIKGGEFVSLGSEIKHVRDYLMLQDARFEDELSYEIDVEQDSEDLEIPKMSIQTLVENSIIHGMQGPDGRVHLKVSVSLKGNLLRIAVEDNGSGISGERLDYLRQQFSGVRLKDDQTSSLGLINLNSRLHILYEGKAGLEITSREEKGTCVVLTIPVFEEHLYV